MTLWQRAVAKSLCHACVYVPFGLVGILNRDRGNLSDVCFEATFMTCALRV